MQLAPQSTTWLRPDDRMFVEFECHEISAYAPLTEAAAAAHARPLYTMVDEDDRTGVVALRAAGFHTDLVIERFRVTFDAALDWFGGAAPAGFRIDPADVVDEARLFSLDNAIRNDVPGTDGWRGDWAWFRQELTEAPPFDADAYPVAIDEANGEYVGLARIWRNPDGPKFGLVGVLRQYRGTPVAAALLDRALTAASAWGHDTFTVETSPASTRIYKLLVELNAERIGRSLRQVRR